MKIKEKVFIQGKIQTITGLHIGGSSIGLAIGGADSIVIRNPLTNQPYIPGSSLKGKMRSLLELLYGLSKEGKVCSDTNETITQLFGISAEAQDQPCPTRLIVRDASFTDESEEKLANARNTDMLYTEVKTEVVLDRFSAQAVPRQLERVPAGSNFQFEMILTLYENDDRTTFLNKLTEGMEILQEDYLGGSGTRGYGQIKFQVESVKAKGIKEYQQEKPEPRILQEELAQMNNKLSL
ncbi:MAG: CRISPR-associated protein Csm3 [bacterium]|jgi:CRISPR-associated protein Csm3